jgi:NADH-quinone oxidoreductase subunit J
MNEALFFFAGPIAVLTALGVVVLRNPFYAVLSLVVHLLSLSLLFLLLYAPFLAVIQVMVYVGAVMVLYVFVNAYVGGADDAGGGPGRPLRWLAGLISIGVAATFGIALLGSGLTAIDSDGAEVGADFGSPGQIGELLLTKFLLPFELASFLLLVAAVGAVVLARRRGGTLPGETRMIAALDLLAPTGTGSMREGIGAINPVPGAVNTKLPSGTRPDGGTASGGTASRDGGEER